MPMRRPARRLAIVALLAPLLLVGPLLAGPALAGIEVRFVNPETFTDADFRTPAVRAGVLADFSAFFARLGKSYLKGDQALTIDVLDMKLAGEFEPWRRPGWNDVRILRDITPPRFVLRYTLKQNGKVVVSATETVTDIAYMWDPSAARSSERFAFDYAVLKAWFRDRFVALKPPRAGS